ncbi:flavin reductase family protein [Paenibacillus sp. P26]|nr:flavin reductase family protein [Paenibacillus sp. P26]
MVSISVQRQSGKQKDTSRNAIEKGAFVVHISDESYIDAINQTAANLSPHESEVELAGLTPVQSAAIDVPGVAEAKIRMECILEQAIPLGGNEEAPGCDLLIGRVVHFHIHESLYHEGRIDFNKLHPVSRLAGDFYSKLGELFSLERPRRM